MNTVPKTSTGQTASSGGTSGSGAVSATKPKVGYQGGAAGGVTPNTY